MSYRTREISLLIYQKIFDVFDGDKGSRVALIFGRVFNNCTPAFAEPYRIERKGDLFNLLSLSIYIAALINCFILTAVLTLVNGTFCSASGNSIEFLEDRWNIFFYLVICPAYVTLCIRMLLLAMERDVEENNSELKCSTSAQARRIFITLFFITIFSSILITNYVNDALDSSIVMRKYWFIEEFKSVRRLNSAGLYYIVLNFSLLFITFLGATAFISISIDGIKLSKSLTTSDKDVDFNTYKSRLDRLVVAYFWGVLLVACYALNIIVWKHSPLGTVANVDIAGAMFTIVGIIFVTIPRRFIEHVWSSYCAKKNKNENGDDDSEHQDIVPIIRSRIMSGIQFLCVVGWFPNFYDLKKYSDYVDPYYWINIIFGQ